MKTPIKFVLFIYMVSVSLGAKSETIGESLRNHPEQFRAVIEEKDYSKQLQFIKDLYAEHQANPEDTVAEYVCITMIGRVPLDHQLALSLDFTLNQTDMHMRWQGAHAVYITLAEGPPPDEATRIRLVAKLKQDLGGLTAPSRDAFDLARYEVDALILLGDDAGLDGFLTDKQSVRNYSVIDNWDVDSDASRFDQLVQRYTEKANDSGNRNPNSDKTMAATYRLAKDRRLRGIKLEPLHPLANLNQLSKQ